MNPARVRFAAGILATAAVALAGCGGNQPPAPAADGTGADTLPAAYDAERAADLPKLTTERAVHTSQRIALVVARRAQVVALGGTPYTRTTFAVQQVIKGRLPHRFVLQVIGGRLGDSVVTSPVAPFIPTARYIVFLGANGINGPTIAPQATIAVHGDAQLRRAVAHIRRYVP